MPGEVKGIKTQSILQVEEDGAIDRYGVDMITRVEKIPKDGFPALIRSKYSLHPRFTTMAVSRITWARVDAGQFYRVTYLYEGFLGSLPEPEYELDVSTAEEPIATHPDFETFAGTAAAPLNGAVFIDPETGKPTTDNAKGVFREFSMSGDKAGVEGYLSPGASWSEISFSSTRPSGMGDIGEIDEPAGSEPSFGSGRNWIYSGANYRRRGNIYEVRKTWLLSGRNGWDADIY